MKRYLVFALFSISAAAQNTSVTATITDPDGQTWNNGTYTINFIPTPGVPGPFTWNGVTNFPQNYTGSISNSGVITITLPDNNFVKPLGTKWQFTLCSNTSAPCQNVTTPVSGASINLSSTLSNALTAPRFGPGPFAFGYRDVEASGALLPGMIYFNVTNLVQRIWTGTLWQNSAGGGGLITVNGGSTVPSPANLNNTTPAAPPNALNIGFAVAGSNISGFLQGDGSATHCLLGTGIFSACPGGGSLPNPFIANSNIPVAPPTPPGASTSTIAIDQSGKLAQAVNASAFFDEVNTKLDSYDTSTFNFPPQFPTSPSALTGGTPATVTVNCWRGLDSSYLVINSDTILGDYWIDIGTTGTPESIWVSATTCSNTSNGATGTITFTPLNSHSAGYSIGPATQGAQEAINWGKNIQGGKNFAIKLSCLNSSNINWDAPLITGGNFIYINGNNCRVNQTHRGKGIIFGDQNAGLNNFFFNGVENLRIVPNFQGAAPQINLIQSVTQSGTSPATFTITYTSNHDFNLGDWECNEGQLNYNVMAGCYQVLTVPAANQITIQRNNAPALVGAVFAGGFSDVEYTALEDNLSSDGRLYKFSISAALSGNKYHHGIVDTTDQQTILDHFTTEDSGNTIRPATTEATFSVIYGPGSSGFNSGSSCILRITDSSIYGGAGATGFNPIDDFCGNDLSIVNSLIQNWAEFPLRSSNRRGGFGFIDITNTHIEEGGSGLSPAGNIGVAGIISTGQALTFTGGEVIFTFVPKFGTVGDGLSKKVYYIEPVSNNADTLCSTQSGDQRCIAGTNYGNGPLIPAGYGLIDSGSGGTLAINWPPVRAATSYNIYAIFTTPTSTSPITEPFGTGTFLVASAVNPLTACTDRLCSFSDTTGLTLTSTTIPQYVIGAYCPYLDFWYGSPVIGCGSDLHLTNSIAIRYYGPAPIQNGSTILNSLGTNAVTFTNQPGSVAVNNNFMAFGMDVPPFDNNGGAGTQTTIARFIPNTLGSNTGSDGGIVQNTKGVQNFTGLAIPTYPFDLQTFRDSNIFKTLATVNNKPSWDAGDTSLGLDQSGGLHFRAATSFSWYVNTLPNSGATNWSFRATANGFASKPVAFSTLGACSATLAGTDAVITDANTLTWGATVAGGGTPGKDVKIFCDGANWTVEAI